MLPGNVYNFGESMPPLLREDTPQAATEHAQGRAAAWPWSSRHRTGLRERR
jgi:hypothetical protein